MQLDSDDEDNFSLAANGRPWNLHDIEDTRSVVNLLQALSCIQLPVII